MKESKCNCYEDLRMKVRKQEEYIAQLVEIVAVTNRKMDDIEKRMTQLEHRMDYQHHNLIC